MRANSDLGDNYYVRVAVRSALALVLGLALAACGGGVAAQRDVPLDEIEPQTAKTEAKAVVDEAVAVLRRTDSDGLFSVVEEGAIVLGPGGPHAFSNRTDAVVALGPLLGAHKGTLPLTTGKPVVGVAPMGHAAWVVQNLIVADASYIATTIAIETNGIWRIAAVFLSNSIGLAPLHKANREGRLTVPAVTLPTLPAGPGAVAARSAATALTTMLKKKDAVVRALLVTAEGREALSIGPAGESFARGKKALRKLIKKRADSGAHWEMVDPVVAQVTPDERLAWATTVVEESQDGDEDAYLLRLFVIMTRDAADAPWQVATVHQAVAIGAAPAVSSGRAGGGRQAKAAARNAEEADASAPLAPTRQRRRSLKQSSDDGAEPQPAQDAPRQRRRAKPVATEADAADE